MESSRSVIIDAGPLVAALDRRDRYHQWASEVLRTLMPPLTTSESVLSETCFLLRRVGLPSRPLFDLLKRNLVSVGFHLEGEEEHVAELIRKYADVSMSLADATMVRLAELDDAAAVMTIDSDFRIYRKNGRQRIPLIMPDDER